VVAGINAARSIEEKIPFVLERDNSYIGVLIDDLVTKGVDEPYRMFTSRAEFRILLRQDNADERLTPISYKMGLAGQERMETLDEKIKKRESLISFLNTASVAPGEVNKVLDKLGTSQIKQKVKSISLVSRPQIKIDDLWDKVNGLEATAKKLNIERGSEIVEDAEIAIKYSGYIDRERKLADKIKRLGEIKLDPSIEYEALKSISTEARQKLKKIKPATIGQASRISGVSPSDISVLLVYMGR